MTTSVPKEKRLAPRRWVIVVGGGYGAFLFRGTETEAEEMRAHKANWEGAVARKRRATTADIAAPSSCWNHPGFNSKARYHCECGGCHE